MPKRAADKYLTDRNVDELDEEAEPAVNGEFSMASAATLSKRPMKALPGRRTGQAGATSPFAPASHAAADNPKASFASTNGILDGGQTDDPTATLISQRGLNVSALKAFASLSQRVTKDPFVDLTAALEELSTNYGRARVTVQRAKTPIASTSMQAPLPAAVEAPISKPLSFGTPASGPVVVPADTVEVSKPSSPAPPSAFSFGGQVIRKPTTSNAPAVGGFTPTPNASSPEISKSAFSFALPGPSQVQDPQPAATSSAASSSSLHVPALAFNSATAASATPKKPSPLRQAETMLSSPASGGAQTPPRVATDGGEEPKKAPNPFAGFSFGQSAPAVSSAPPIAAAVVKPSVESGADKIKEQPGSFGAKPVTPPKPLTNAFGGGKAASPPGFGAAGKTSAFGVVPQSAFGGGPSVGFSFGSSFPNLGAAVPPSSTSFGFGNGSSPTLVASTSTTGTSPSVFGSSPAGSSAFKAPVASFTPVPSSSEPTEPPNAVEDGGQGADAAAIDIQGSAPISQGAGEEDDETLHEVRARLYLPSSKPGEGDIKSTLTTVRLKKNKETGVARLLARAEAGMANVILNARVYQGLVIRVTEPRAGDDRPQATLNFFTFENGEATPVLRRMRVKNMEQADAFANAVHAEVARL